MKNSAHFIIGQLGRGVEFDGEEGAEPLVDAEIAQVARGVGSWNGMDGPVNLGFEGL